MEIEIEVKNNAESLIYSTEKMIAEYKDKVEKEVVEKIEKEINELKDVLKDGNTEDIKSKLESVQKVSQEMGAKMYEQAAKEQASKSEGDGKADENIVDAELVDDDIVDAEKEDANAKDSGDSEKI